MFGPCQQDIYTSVDETGEGDVITEQLSQMREKYGDSFCGYPAPGDLSPGAAMALSAWESKSKWASPLAVAVLILFSPLW